jgi:membrane protein required for colicin V production
MMNWADILIIALLVISAGIGIYRGMFKEVLSLVNWIAAFIIAQSFWPAFDHVLKPIMQDASSIRAPLAWAILFVCSILVGSLIQRIVLEVVRVTGLTGSDRALGAVFGLLRGIVIIVLLLIFMPMLIDFTQDTWWKESKLLPFCLALTDSVMMAMNALVSLVRSISIG